MTWLSPFPIPWPKNKVETGRHDPSKSVERERESGTQRHREKQRQMESREKKTETWGEDRMNSRVIEMEERRREMCIWGMWLKNWYL